MLLQFAKYQGTGNDFILIDNRINRWRPDRQEIARLCDRHFGIGADGLMLLSEEAGYPFRMTYYNSDGLESTMCGNGGRCIAVFARRLGLTGDFVRFMTIDGEHYAEIQGIDKNPSHVRLKMRDATIDRQFEDGLLINTGSPHFVRFVANTDQTEVFTLGKVLRFDPRFSPEGANINFAEVQSSGIYVRTYERGVENETLSCGTGVTATALAAAFLTTGHPEFYMIKTRGGNLKVSFKQSGQFFTEIWLEGDVTTVFEGHIEIDPLTSSF